MPSGTGEAARPNAFQGHDAVRSTFEAGWFTRLIPWLLSRAGGGELLDLGCGDAGIEPLLARDRTLQAGPKLGEEGYWPGLPSVRPALNALVDGPGTAHDRDELAAALPPLPAGDPALLHHALAARRRALMRRPGASAAAIWSLEPPTGGGFGHGLLLVGRVRP